MGCLDHMLLKLHVLKDVDFANFVNNNMPYISEKNTDELIESREKARNTLLQWFKDNLFKGNPGKCYLIVITNLKINVNVGEFYIESSDCEKLLGVKIDTKLTFGCHVSDICKKANGKINTLFRIASYINVEIKRILMN